MQPSAAAPQASDRIWCKRATPALTAIRFQFVVAAHRASQLHVAGSTHQNSVMWKIWQNPCGEPSPAIPESVRKKKAASSETPAA